VSLSSFGQNTMDLKATFDMDKMQIKISQIIQYQNTTSDILETVYLNDWSNSFSSKSSPLALRLAEEYKNEFHFAKNEDRGFSVITVLQQDYEDVQHERLKDQLDIVKVLLNKPLHPGESYTLQLEYIVQIPSSKFTRYGVSPSNNISLRYWYITPSVYDGTWHYFSNKDLDDSYIPKSSLKFSIEYPERYILATELDQIDQKKENGNIVSNLVGHDRVSSKLYLSLNPQFNTVETDYFAIVSNIDDENLGQIDRLLIIDKIANFISKNIGDYPHEKLLVTSVDYKKSPIYGLNLLPDFIRPFPDHFQYELKVLKTTLRNYLENVLLINPRKDQWLIDGIQIYYLRKYVDENYPDMKIFGALSNVWGIKSFHAAKLHFNDQYRYTYLNMAKENKDQPLTMSKDSLLKFNKNLANPNKAALGLRYLNDFDPTINMDESLLEFINLQSLKPTTTKDFEIFIKNKASKNIDWFFTDYLNTTEKIDYKIETVEQSRDSVKVTIKNKRGNTMPSALFGMKNDSVVSKTWLENIKDKKTIKLAKNEATKLVINQDESILEINNRNNTKTLTNALFNRPIQLRLIKDVEDPRYNQIFLMPIVEYNNIYDGIVLGVKPYNKSILRKPFTYKLAPQYATKSNSLTGSANFIYQQYIDNIKNLYKIQYVLTGSYSSYAEDLFVTSFKPSITFNFRDTRNLRSNKRQVLNFRYVSINRDKDVNNILDSPAEPNYNVFNIRYVNRNPNLIDYSAWYADFQAAQSFSKVSLNYEYRKLFENNQQLKIRLFAGVFLKNKNETTNDYFSFALDRPTDYLFDYQYLGRSESSGLFSQQLIIAEGGFKSKLDTPFANQWMATANITTSIWNYIHVYGDIGAVKNKQENANFVYDSGFRINLVEDYFEIYFPVYSNLGWEVSQSQYSQKIRFIFTADLQALFGLFRRRWY
jgi:hypothetical protein